MPALSRSKPSTLPASFPMPSTPFSVLLVAQMATGKMVSDARVPSARMACRRFWAASGPSSPACIAGQSPSIAMPPRMATSLLFRVLLPRCLFIGFLLQSLRVRSVSNHLH